MSSLQLSNQSVQSNRTLSGNLYVGYSRDVLYLKSQAEEKYLSQE